ncbi:hypothetical protein BDF19DRAFT_117101 [Syncephalis fuscata]|nr:hypothetical protein BDF19DRAFT_117101 [Syncephalis fuscata]
MTETRNGRRGRKSLRNRLSEEDLHDMVYENAIDLNATSTSYPANNGLAHSHTMNNQAHFEPIVASPPPPLSPSLVLDDMATVGVVTRAKARELWATYCQQSTTSPTMANYNSSFMQVVAENANNNKTSHYSQPHHTDISDNYRETTPPLSEEGRTMFTPMFKSLSVSQPKTPTTRPKKRTAKKSAVIDAANACLSIATQTSDVTTRNVMTSTRLSSTESIGEVQNDPAIAPQSVSPNSILYSNPLVAMMPRSASNSNIQSTSTTNGEPIQRVTTPPPKTSAEPPTQTITDDVIFSSPNRMPGSPTFNRHPNRSDANRYISRPNGAQWEQRAELHAARHVGAVVAQLTSNNHKRSAPETDTEHAQSK